MENLLAKMSAVVKRHRKQMEHRNRCREERAWKSQLNYTFAKACLDLLYQSLDQSRGGSPEHRSAATMLAELLCSLHIKS